MKLHWFPLQSKTNPSFFHPIFVAIVNKIVYNFANLWKKLQEICQIWAFWAAAPKGRCPVEHRGEFRDFCPSVRPSVCPSVRPPPLRWPSRPQISPPRTQFSPPGLKSALLASNQPPSHALNLPLRPQICPPDLQSALPAYNQPAKPQICSQSLNYAL